MVYNAMNKTIEETKEYIGMWVTKDGYIHHAGMILYKEKSKVN
jgi:hypothetical protein